MAIVKDMAIKAGIVDMFAQENTGGERGCISQ